MHRLFVRGSLLSVLLAKISKRGIIKKNRCENAAKMRKGRTYHATLAFDTPNDLQFAVRSIVVSTSDRLTGREAESRGDGARLAELRGELIKNSVFVCVALAILVLIVLPVGSLLIGSMRSDGGFTLDNFVEALTGRLTRQALVNSLILGGWTAFFSVLIGVPLAWAVSRANVPGKGMVFATATLSYLSPPFLTAIAFVSLLSPNAGILNVFFRDVVGAPSLTFNIFSMAGLVLVTTLHTFPFVFLLASSALRSVDASYEEAAQILGAGKVRTALSISLPLVAPAVLSGTLLAFVNAIALFGSQAIIGLPARIFTLPTRITRCSTTLLNMAWPQLFRCSLLRSRLPRCICSDVFLRADPM